MAVCFSCHSLMLHVSVMALSHPEVDENGVTVMTSDPKTGLDTPVMFQGYNIMGVGTMVSLLVTASTLHSLFVLMNTTRTT